MSASRRKADLTVARVGQLHIGFRLEAVQEVLMGTSITPVPLADPGCAGLINVRGEIMSVVDLAARLDVEPQPEDGKPPSQVIVRTSRGLVAVTVDRVNDVVHAPAEAHEEVQAQTAEFFSGAYALAGRLVLVLDIDRVVWGNIRDSAA
ncbi:MAG: chemotaxis protein CheW [Actinomycetes bacterium]